jgi:hypothetical protein
MKTKFIIAAVIISLTIVACKDKAKEKEVVADKPIVPTERTFKYGSKEFIVKDSSICTRMLGDTASKAFEETLLGMRNDSIYVTKIYLRADTTEGYETYVFNTSNVDTANSFGELMDSGENMRYLLKVIAKPAGAIKQVVWQSTGEGNATNADEVEVYFQTKEKAKGYALTLGITNTNYDK